MDIDSKKIELIESEIGSLNSRLDEATEEIVALKGIVSALLSKTNFEDKKINEWITRLSKNPVGKASPEDAIACAENILEETKNDRISNLPKKK